jgi:NADH dehydrogenase
MREGKIVAQNVVAALSERPLRAFSFKTIGLLASIGRRMGVARILGFNFSGFFAWWMWRTVYLCKLPGLDKKVRVAFDWTLDLLFPKDVCAIYEPDDRRDLHGPNLIQGNVPSQRDRIETVRESYQAAN